MTAVYVEKDEHDRAVAKLRSAVVAHSRAYDRVCNELARTSIDRDTRKADAIALAAGYDALQQLSARYRIGAITMTNKLADALDAGRNARRAHERRIAEVE